MKKNIFALSAIVALLVFSTCEKASTSGADDSSPGNSNFYVLNLKKEATRPGFTLLNAESYQQTTEYTCGPAAALSLLRYFGKDGVEMTIASEMGTSSTTGTTPEQMTSWLSTHGFRASWHEGGNLDTLRNNLKNKIPTLVEWSDWGGHWVLAVGYDTRNTETTTDDVIVFADPYDRHDDNMDGLTWFNAERFYYMWYDALLFGKVMKRIYISATPAGS
ncbi:MAG: C39 family peptidase [Bacteroidota bacterium]